MAAEFDCPADRCFVRVAVRDDNNSVSVHMQILITDDQLTTHGGVKNATETNCFLLDNIHQTKRKCRTKHKFQSCHSFFITLVYYLVHLMWKYPCILLLTADTIKLESWDCLLNIHLIITLFTVLGFVLSFVGKILKIQTE